MSIKKRYILTYRDGINSLPVFGFVEFSELTTMRDIVVRCQKFCRDKNYRYMSVKPELLEIEEPKIPEGQININLPQNEISKPTDETSQISLIEEPQVEEVGK